MPLAIEEQLHQTILGKRGEKGDQDEAGLRRVATKSSNLGAVLLMAGEADNQAIQEHVRRRMRSLRRSAGGPPKVASPAARRKPS